MKSPHHFFRLGFCMAILLMTANLSLAQKTIIWKGGTPGMKNEWSCPQNWSTASVPDEFSDVIIPDVSTSSFSLPILRSEIVEINSLEIHSPGYLTILDGATLRVQRSSSNHLRALIRGKGTYLDNERAWHTPEHSVAFGQE